LLALAESFRGREYTFLKQRGANFDQLGIIHRQDGDCHPTDSGAADQIRTIPAKVSFPLVSSWIEEPGEFLALSVDPRDIWPFVAVAVQAGQSQIVEYRWPAMLSSDDVIDGKGNGGVERLRHAAILAGMVGPAPHLLG
jgi:hypothetical protein